MKGVARDGQVLWFQMYVNSSRRVVKEMLERVWNLGVRVVCLTVDAPTLGKREKDMRVKFVDEAPDVHTSIENKDQGAARAISSFIDPRFDGILTRVSLSWKDIPWFKQTMPKMKFVIKGIQCGEDALIAVKHGVFGIIVSNHGGRQLDGCRSGIEVLEEVIGVLKHHRVRDKLEVYVDGGFRRGSDVVKALCIGADGVGLGRPFLYGMAGYGDSLMTCRYGHKGVEKVIDMLKEEIEMNMR
jgi:L-lactate dehydrogenase (cytochrome)